MRSAEGGTEVDGGRHHQVDEWNAPAVEAPLAAPYARVPDNHGRLLVPPGRVAKLERQRSVSRVQYIARSGTHRARLINDQAGEFGD